MPSSARTLLLSLLLIVCVAGTANAQSPSTSLNWDHCAGEGRIADRTFACNTNSGNDQIVFAMVLHDSTRTGVAGWEAQFDFSPVSATIPPYWQIDGCRRVWDGFVFSVGLGYAAIPPTACKLWMGTNEGSGLSAYFHDAPDRLHVTLQGIIAAPATVTLLAGQEYILCRLIVGRERTVGTGSCAGCSVPTCIGVSRPSLKYRGSRPPEYFPTTGLNSVTWQGGYVADYPELLGPCSDPSNCPNRLQCTLPPVPAQGRTWGMIKTLYR